jgi:4a-hydroxytetrahydrobiopterin dehydratase
MYEAVTAIEIDTFLAEMDGWSLSPEQKLTKAFKFKNFNEGLEFVNQIAAIADRLDHHPDILLSWGKVELSIYTHCKNALTRTDFELAKQIDLLVAGFSSSNTL